MTNQEKITMYEQITKHGNNLLAIFPQATIQDPVKLCKALRRLERKAEGLTTDYCNTGEPREDEIKAILTKVKSILKPSEQIGAAMFVNMDPRGYALKIQTATALNLALYSDMGGYGIIAPDFTP